MEWTKETEKKRNFLTTYDGYGYQGEIEHIRKDFSQLRESIYLDHAGGTLYSESQIQQITRDLSFNLYGNPHSYNPSSLLSSKKIGEVRKSILEFLNTNSSKYSVIFTSGCTGALKLVGETFPWTPASHFYYLNENHNSVLGIREYAAEKGAMIHSIHLADLLSLLNNEKIQDEKGFNLVAIPAENNFSGTKIPLQFIKQIKENRNGSKWQILLDAAAFVANSKLDLTEFPADFVTVSFYKMFGYPTGIGALIVKNESSKLLKKIFFGGGTVAASLSSERFHVLRNGISEKFEDGTISFLNIIALKYGFDILNNLGMDNITRHTHSLIQYLYTQLNEMVHENGNPVCVIYGEHYRNDSSKQGPILTFNFLRPNGNFVGYNEVEQLATLNNIHLRTGCFCNPGSCCAFLQLSNEEVKKNLEAGHVCWDDKDIINGKPTGAVRISLGYMSTWEDVEVFILFTKKYFVKNDSSFPLLLEAVAPPSPNQELLLEAIYLYPIKSCGRLEVIQWEITDNGLQYDREWVLVDVNGDYLNQKKLWQLCLIKPTIDLEQNIMRIDAPGAYPLELSLSYCPSKERELTVCGDSCFGYEYTSEVNNWFSSILQIECFLVRVSPLSGRVSGVRHTIPPNRREDQKSKSLCPISFSNESQFLIVSKASVEDLVLRVKNSVFPITPTGFRPNLVIKGGTAYQEDNWKDIQIGDQHFTITSLCNRCKMICIDQETGIEGREPLLTLATYRRNNGRVYFGVHAEHDKYISRIPFLITCGTEIHVQTIEERKF